MLPSVAVILKLTVRLSNFTLIRKEYVLLKPEYVLPEFLLEYEYTLAGRNGTPSQSLSVSSNNQGAAPIENIKGGTFAPRPLAFIQNNCDSFYGNGFECSNIGRSKSDVRNIGRNYVVGAPAEIKEGINVSSSMKKEGKFQSNLHAKNGGKATNMADNHYSYLVDKQIVVHHIKNARVDYVARRNESVKRGCFPFI